MAAIIELIDQLIDWLKIQWWI